MKLTAENKGAFNRAAHIFSEATGTNPADAVKALDVAALRAVIEGLRMMSPVSPLADELETILED